MAGTSRVVIRRKATRKDGNSKGTVKSSTSVAVSGNKATTRKTRKVIPSVSYVKGS